MKKTMYRTSSYGIEIKPVKVVRESTAFVTWEDKNINGDLHRFRSRRHTEYHDFHETWEAARDHLREQAARGVDSAQKSLTQAQKHLAKIEALEP